MATRKPQVIVIGGPNGAGKSTLAGGLIRDMLSLGEFVNADAIALGLAAFAPERVAVSAGKVMLTRLRELATLREDFAFESTLATRSFGPWLQTLRADGYQVNLAFMWLASPELALKRVAGRVQTGGHSVPEEVVRRRYHRSIHNLIHRYLPIADRYRIYDNSTRGRTLVVVEKELGRRPRILNKSTWKRIQIEAGYGDE